MTTRVRFAPSPTGFLHVGSARTALFNWLHARHVGGTFVLRIEDTDLDRSKPELVDNILRTLEWLGIDWDEGPLRQSERRDRHMEAVEQLLGSGQAYTEDGAVRFKTPDSGITAWDDIVRGRVEFENENLEDFVIRRSDGSPVFLLANAVDDIDMGITHAIHGEDLVNTVPKVLLLMSALGAETDLTYAHLPLLVGKDRKKLSKRKDDVAIEDFRDRGFLPAAMANYLALLGWGPKDEIEIRPMSEIVELFDLNDVNAASAFFDVKKLTSFNGDYIRMLSDAELVDVAAPWLPDETWRPQLEELAPVMKPRLRTLDEVPSSIDWLALDEPQVDQDAWEKVMVNGPAAAELLDETIAAYETCEWDADTLHAALLAIGEAHELKLGKAQAPVRVAITGRSVGLPLFEMLVVLGRDKSLARMRAARQRL